MKCFEDIIKKIEELEFCVKFNKTKLEIVNTIINNLNSNRIENSKNIYSISTYEIKLTNLSRELVDIIEDDETELNILLQVKEILG